MKRITKTSITISFFVLFTVSLLIQSFLFIGVSQAQVKLSPKYIRTGEGWDGAKINNQNIYIAWQKQNPKTIAFFEQSGNGLYKQRPTYYSLPEGSFVAECPSWIQNQNLYTQDKSTADGGCEPDWGKSPYDRGDNKGFVNLKFDVPEFKNLSELYNLKAEVFTPDLQKYIRERNYFEVPYGCPGAPEPSRGTRNGLVASANAVYACPGADGSINTLINGVINKGKFEQVDDQTWNQILNDAIAEDAKGEEVTGTEGEKCTDQLTPFGWVLCPVISLSNGVYDFFVTQVNNLLFFESGRYDNPNTQQIWRTFATIANSIIIIIGLIIIISQIFNFEFISAYTIKKALPRLVIGAILIQLSWFIFTAMIQIVNALGSGLYDLILSPFSGPTGVYQNGEYVSLNAILSINGLEGDRLQNEGWNALGSLLFVGAIAGVALTGAWLSLIVTMLGALISIIVALFVIIVREGLLVILLVISPIALALWILPGTNKFWKTWWDNFSKLLLMYPLIILLFAAGTISALILVQSGSPIDQDNVNINKFFAIIAFFAPLFLIGATFKMAGSGLQAISGITSNLGNKAKQSGMFGLRERAKFNKDNSVMGIRKKIGQYEKENKANQKYIKYLGNNNSLGGRLATMGYSQRTKDYAQTMGYAKIAEEKEKEKKGEATKIEIEISQMNNGTGLSYPEKEKFLVNAAAGGGARGSAAIEMMAQQNMHGGFSALHAINTDQLSEYERQSPNIAGYLRTNRRDLTAGWSADDAGSMSFDDLMSQKDSFWGSNNPHRGSIPVSKLRALYESDGFSRLGDEAQSFIASQIGGILESEGRTFHPGGGSTESRRASNQSQVPQSSREADPNQYGLPFDEEGNRTDGG